MIEPDTAFWDRVKKARGRILALDYDGTLAPFQVDRMAALPLSGIPEAIASILDHGGARVAVISGRPLAELSELMGGLLERVTVVGAHGWQWKEPGGRIQDCEPEPAVKARLDRAAAAAREAGRQVFKEELDPEARVERKTASVAVHVRGLEPETAEVWLELVKDNWAAISEGLELLAFDGGLELRDPGRNKGQSVRELKQRFPAPDLMVYVGDDRTDEDAFSELGPGGVGIKVGVNDELTAATYALRDCEAVREFLVEWDQLTRAQDREGRS